MARPFRFQYDGAIYHVTARGNERRPVFRDDADRTRFVDKLRELAEMHHVLLYAYALMPNHYHLVVCTPRANLSAFMQQFNTSYTVYFNRHHRRTGHLFADRFKARLIEGGGYLLAVTRYVHLNPVKVRAARALAVAERVQALRQYPWSSYRGYAGLSKAAAWVDYEPLRAFSDLAAAAHRAAYAEYVEARVAEDDAELQDAMAQSSKAIGSEAFCRDAELRMRNALPRLARWVDISRRRLETALDPEAVLAAVAAEAGVTAAVLHGRGNHEFRDVLIRLWREESGLTLREIGWRLGHADGATVGKRWRALVPPSRQAPAVTARCQAVLRRIDKCKA